MSFGGIIRKSAMMAFSCNRNKSKNEFHDFRDVEEEEDGDEDEGV